MSRRDSRRRPPPAFSALMYKRRLFFSKTMIEFFGNQIKKLSPSPEPVMDESFREQFDFHSSNAMSRLDRVCVEK